MNNQKLYRWLDKEKQDSTTGKLTIEEIKAKSVMPVWKKMTEENENKKDQIRVFATQNKSHSGYSYYINTLEDEIKYIQNTPQESLCQYEVVHAQSKLVFDIEFHQKNGIIDKDLESRMITVRESIEAAVIDWYKPSEELRSIYLDSSGMCNIWNTVDYKKVKVGSYFKVSKHLIIENIITERIEDQKKFVEYFINNITRKGADSPLYKNFMEENGENRKCILDDSIYTKCRLMRMLGSSKLGEYRPLTIQSHVGPINPELFSRCILTPTSEEIRKAKELSQFIDSNGLPSDEHPKKKLKVSSTKSLSTGHQSEQELEIISKMKEVCPNSEFNRCITSKNERTLIFTFFNAKYCMKRKNEHANNNTYIKYSPGENVIRFTCHDRECTSEDVKVLIPDHIMETDIPRSVCAFPDFKTIHKRFINKKDVNFFNKDATTLRIVSRMGSAKSEILNKEIFNLYKKAKQEKKSRSELPTVYLVTSSRGLAENMIKKCVNTLKILMPESDNLVCHYEKMIIDGKSFQDEKIVIIQLESIYRLENCPPPNLLILDEYASVLSHFQSSTMEKMKAENCSFLEMLITFSKKVIVADADYNSLCETILRDCRSTSIFDGLFNTHVRDMINDGNGFSFPERKLLIQDNEQELCKKLQQSLIDGKKCVVVSNIGLEGLKANINSIETFVNQFRNQNNLEPLKILWHTSQDRHEAKKLKDPHSHWNQYDLLVYSPSVTVGVDFSTLYFDCVFAFATNNTNNVRSFIQQLARVRYTKEPLIYISFNIIKFNNLEHFPVTEDAVLEHLRIYGSAYSLGSSSIKYSNKLSLNSDGVYVLSNVVLMDFYTKIYIANTIEDNLSKIDFKNIFLDSVYQKGLTYSHDQNTLSEDELTSLKEKKIKDISDNKIQWAESVIQIDNISDIDASILRNQIEITEEDKKRMLKHQIVKSFGEPNLNVDFILKFNSNRKASRFLHKISQPLDFSHNTLAFNQSMLERHLAKNKSNQDDTNTTLKPKPYELSPHTAIDAYCSVDYTKRVCLQFLLDITGVSDLTRKGLLTVEIKSDDIKSKIEKTSQNTLDSIDSFFRASLKTSLFVTSKSHNRSKEVNCRRIIKLFSTYICKPMNQSLIYSSRYRKKSSQTSDSESINTISWTFDKEKVDKLFCFSEALSI